MKKTDDIDKAMGRRKATPEERAANIKALNELHRLFPKMKPDEVGDWLFASTAYPFASLPECMKQARRLAKKSGGDHVKAMNIAANED